PAPVNTFMVPGMGVPTGVEFSSLLQTPKLYVAKVAGASTMTVVAHFTVDLSCNLIPPGLVATAAGGGGSNVSKLSPDETCLFVPNNLTPFNLTTFTVDPVSGALTLKGVFGRPNIGVGTSAAAFVSTGTGLVFYTNTFNPRQVVRRHVNDDCSVT